jgi:hypothetical protein
VEKEVGQWNRHEQQQRRLHHSGEDAGLSDEQDRGDTSQGVTGRECGAQLAVAGAGFDREAGDYCGYRHQHRTPGRQTRTVPERGALIVCVRPLSWHS